MKRAALTLSALAMLFVTYSVVSNHIGAPPLIPSVAAKGGGIFQPCDFPTEVNTAEPSETAWQLFVAATCTVNKDKYPYVVWETWLEQSQVYTASGQTLALAEGERPRFHVSPLALIMQQKQKTQAPLQPDITVQVASQDCNTLTWSGRTICEEARLNPATVTYVTTNQLTTHSGQIAFVTAGKKFDFTRPSIEIKADWIKLPSCDSPPQGVHIETINNVCYALGGVHLISKLANKWVWATFEPQNATTNPQRCKVLGCRDAYGSNPETSSGANTQLTQALTILMSAAQLQPEWKNYRLDGVQVDFTKGGKNTLLGNSIIEGDNAGTPTQMRKSSCITCHHRSAIDKNGNPALPVKFKAGPPKAYPTGVVSRDFVWSLWLAR